MNAETTRFELSPELARSWPGEPVFDEFLEREGEVFRQAPARRTVRFEVAGKGYFLKAHFGVGWKEIFKNLMSLRMPVLGAENELLAIRKLEKLGIDTMRVAGYGSRGCNPASRQSFLVTEELAGMVSLEDLSRTWNSHPPDPALKRRLIRKVAVLARTLHENGVNHRDFYLCHFLVPREPSREEAEPGPARVFLIDLHRVQIRRRTPRRWLVKDLGGLFFSALDIGLTRNDLFRFLAAYRGKPLRTVLDREEDFWRRVAASAARLYLKEWGRPARLPRGIEP